MQLTAFKNLDCQSRQFGEKKNNIHTTPFDYHYSGDDDDTNKNDVAGKRREASNKTEHKQV